jgi:O-antigen/teichoic acid export membrane protein
VLGEYATLITIPQLIFTSFSAPMILFLRKKLAINKEETATYMNIVSSFKFYVTVIIILAVLFLKFYNRNSVFDLLLLLTLVKGFEFLADTFLVYFQTEKRFGEYALSKIVYTIFFIGSLLLAYFQFTLQQLFILPAIFSLLLLISVFSIYRKGNLIFTFKVEHDLLKEMCRSSWPILLNSILFQFTSRGYLVILAYFFLPEVVGNYVLVLTLILVATTFSNSLGLLLFSDLTVLYVQNKQYFLRVLNRWIIVLALVGILMTLFLNMAISGVMGVFINLDTKMVMLFRIMSFSVAPLSIIGLIGNIFTIMNEERRGLIVSVISALLSISLFYFSGMSGQIYNVGLSFVIMNLLNFALIYFQIIILSKREI